MVFDLRQLDELVFGHLGARSDILNFKFDLEGIELIVSKKILDVTHVPPEYQVRWTRQEPTGILLGVFQALLIEADPEIRELIASSLEIRFDSRPLVAATGEEGVRLMLESPTQIDAVICECDGVRNPERAILQHLRDTGSGTPLLLLGTANPDSTDLKEIRYLGFIEKPWILEPLLRILAPLTTTASAGNGAPAPKFCRVPPSSLALFQTAPCDLWIASGKVHEKRLLKGQVLAMRAPQSLFVKAEDTEVFLGAIAGQVPDLATLGDLRSQDPGAALAIAQTTLDSIRFVSQKLGVTPAVRETAEQAIRLVVTTIRRNPDFAGLLKRIEMGKPGFLSSHSVMLSHLAPGIAAKLGWSSELIAYKLALAAFFHDITLATDELARLRRLDEMSGQDAFISFSFEELQAFERHPRDAAILLERSPSIPRDVLTILRQHHERPEGGGIPSGLKASAIFPLACVFIVTEDLIHFADGRGPGWTMREFLDFNRARYSNGFFAQILRNLDESAS